MVGPDPNLRHRSSRSLRDGVRDQAYVSVQLPVLLALLTHPAQGKSAGARLPGYAELPGIDKAKCARKCLEGPGNARHPEQTETLTLIHLRSGYRRCCQGVPQNCGSFSAGLTHTREPGMLLAFDTPRAGGAGLFLGETMSHTQIHIRTHHRPRLASSGGPVSSAQNLRST